MNPINNPVIVVEDFSTWTSASPWPQPVLSRSSTSSISSLCWRWRSSFDDSKCHTTL